MPLPQKHHLIIFDLSKNKATKKLFQSYLKTKNPSLIFFNGHGSADTITGYNNEILINSSDSGFFGKINIIYAGSCDCGKILGKDFIKWGVKTFIGYTRKFVFLYFPEFVTKPLKDPIAKIFLEPTNLIPSTIIKGHSAGEAHVRSKNAMYKNFQKLLLSTASSEERYSASLLWSNIKSQIICGSADTCI